MGRARFVFFPTQTYETFGRIIVEAFAKGTPIIASNIGAVK
jgi:glycosyltransferase involved in cell wall biosynthesis